MGNLWEMLRARRKLGHLAAPQHRGKGSGGWELGQTTPPQCRGAAELGLGTSACASCIRRPRGPSPPKKPH